MLFKITLLSIVFSVQFIATSNANTKNSIYPTNEKAPVFSKASMIIHASPQKVWEKLADIDHWNTWLLTVSRSKLNGDLKTNSTFDWKTGSYHIHSTLRTVEQFSKLGWTGKVYGIFAIHNWTFRQVDGNTEVQVSESMQGLVARVFKKSFNRSLRQDMSQSLLYLKQACEAENKPATILQVPENKN